MTGQPCVILGCPMPRVGANLCREHDEATTAMAQGIWRGTRTARPRSTWSTLDDSEVDTPPTRRGHFT